MKWWLKLLALFPLLAAAHPHEWIELRVTPQTNDTGELIALKQHWTFDPYSAQMQLEPILSLDGIDKQKAAFEKFAAEILQFLGETQYYTYGDAPFLPVEDGKLEVDKAGDLVLTFTQRLEKPTHKFTYRTYESTYFIEMLYADDQPTEWQNGCKMTIDEAEPDESQYEMAAALDRGTQAPEGLGELFAQVIVMNCNN